MSLEELTGTLSRLSSGKSLGLDGLTKDNFPVFWNVLGCRCSPCWRSSDALHEVPFISSTWESIFVLLTNPSRNVCRIFLDKTQHWVILAVLSLLLEEDSQVLVCLHTQVMPGFRYDKQFLFVDWSRLWVVFQELSVFYLDPLTLEHSPDGSAQACDGLLDKLTPIRPEFDISSASQTLPNVIVLRNLSHLSVILLVPFRTTRRHPVWEGADETISILVVLLLGLAKVAVNRSTQWAKDRLGISVCSSFSWLHLRLGVPR
eukprot:g45404.t1